MSNTAVWALGIVIAAALVAIGTVTAWFQFRGLRRLYARTHVPSDEFAYLRGRHRRRLVTNVLLAVVGLLVGGAFVSGLEPNIDTLTQKDPDRPADPDAKREMTPEQKTLVKTWAWYWVMVVVLVFVVLCFAMADAWATRRYALQQFAVIREEHQTKLRRDLAVFRAQKDANRGGRGGNRLGSDE